MKGFKAKYQGNVKLNWQQRKTLRKKFIGSSTQSKLFKENKCDREFRQALVKLMK